MYVYIYIYIHVYTYIYIYIGYLEGTKVIPRNAGRQRPSGLLSCVYSRCCSCSSPDVDRC